VGRCSGATGPACARTTLRPDGARGRSCAPRGRTPLVRARRRRAGLSLASAATGGGEPRRMAVDGAVDAPTFVRFLRRLIRDARRKVLLVLGRPEARRARPTRDWLAERGAEIAASFLPPHGPGLDPAEGVDAGLRQAAPREAPARGKQRLKRAAIGHMCSRSKRPKRIRSILQHQQFRYAA
jgi:hypothetical protein